MNTLKSRKLCAICECIIEAEEDLAIEIKGAPIHWFCVEAEAAYDEYCAYEKRMRETNIT